VTVSVGVAKAFSFAFVADGFLVDVGSVRVHCVSME
jgi:hypothetical protein